MTLHLTGRSQCLADIDRPSVRGLGTSDAPCLARALAKAFDYRNTFFHKAPQLDVCNPGQEWKQGFDFVTSSDVFEHVNPPARKAFEGAFSLLAPGGFLFLTVPYTLGETVEHFPELHEYRVDRTGAEPVLVNRTVDGREQRFDKLVFHGGDGATLELRVFGLKSLQQTALEAGFEPLVVEGVSELRFGVVHDEAWSLPLVLRRPA